MFKYQAPYGGELEMEWSGSGDSFVVWGDNGSGDGFFFRLDYRRAQFLCEEVQKGLPQYPSNDVTMVQWLQTWRIRCVRLIRAICPQMDLRTTVEAVDNYKHQLMMAGDPALAEVVRLKKELAEATAKLTPEQQKAVQ